MSDPEVSVVIPCLNEAETIGLVVRRAYETIRALGLSVEVLVADNGSNDASAERAREAGARVIDASEIRGFGAATVAGGRAAHGRWLLFVDADGEHDVGEAGALIAALRQRDALVIGSRYLGRFLPGANPAINRLVGTPALTFLLNRFIGTRITDVNSGFRGIPRELFLALDLQSAGFELCTEMVVRAALLDVAIVEVPITQHRAPAGRVPHLRRFRDGWRHLKFILLHAPDRVLLWPGVGALALGLLMFVPQMRGPVRWGWLSLDIHVMILGVLFLFMGVEMIGSAIVCASIAGEPVAPRGRLSRRLGSYFVLDRVLPLAASLFLVGLISDLWVVKISAAHHFQELTEPRLALMGTTGMGLALQLSVLSFVHSVVASHKPRRS